MGSSPLTRGKRALQQPPRAHRGLIPAHAGKTTAVRQCLPSGGAHPRSRGENARASGTSARQAGSSPLTRGKRGGQIPALAGFGLIPAHAGKTYRVSFETQATQAHPRSRGENTVEIPCQMVSQGSSPLTRGKPSCLMRTIAAMRLIPAHAGKTPRRSWFTIRPPAHPRSRGENQARFPDGRRDSGSSPLTRGKHPGRRERRRRVGLIPAHAGKTRRTWPFRPSRTAHPRSRGENFSHVIRMSPSAGSSPLTRGKPSSTGPPTRWAGLIPAHAGKTGVSLIDWAGALAHPRSRGENDHLVGDAGRVQGSSPLTRGKRG